MEQERWQKIKLLFDASVELPPAKRHRFLDKTCQGDLELRREVESLLAHHDEAETFIKQPAFELTAQELAKEKSSASHGLTFAQYNPLRLLGVGGMGEVYLAEDKRHGRQVAIKILPTEFTIDRERVRRFKREARAASALRHPNILKLYEVGETADGTHFMAMEYVEGETLSQSIQRSLLKLLDILDVAIQVAGALSAAHAAGIIHRDVKPENIMIRSDGTVKVLDFGLAKLTEKLVSSMGADATASFSSDTDPGMVIGTVPYMSPEQARGRDIDTRADIFSLGVVFYEMITGRLPFHGESYLVTLIAILEREPYPLARYVPNTPDELQRIVSKMLRKDPNQRYQAMDDLLVDLQALRGEFHSETSP